MYSLKTWSNVDLDSNPASSASDSILIAPKEGAEQGDEVESVETQACHFWIIRGSESSAPSAPQALRVLAVSVE